MKAKEAALGGALTLRKTVVWTYHGRSGSFLLAEVAASGSTQCVVYLQRGDGFEALGGNEHCRWRQDPVLVWNQNKAWLEFRPSIEQRVDQPMATNGFTAHFSKASGGVCMLGLPSTGFADVRCPNDEAPDSR